MIASHSPSAKVVSVARSLPVTVSKTLIPAPAMGRKSDLPLRSKMPLTTITFILGGLLGAIEQEHRLQVPQNVASTRSCKAGDRA